MRFHPNCKTPITFKSDVLLLSLPLGQRFNFLILLLYFVVGLQLVIAWIFELF